MEQIYDFELTTSQIETLKQVLRVSGLEFSCNLKMYKKLCEAVCDENDEKLIAIYE
jgi:hypothetical protein